MMAIPAKRKLIIDHDGGCDDAVALLLALKDPNTDVIALTTVHGNVSVDQATDNSATILGVLNRRDVPFFKGCSTSLCNINPPEQFVGHGKNGLGDATVGSWPPAFVPLLLLFPEAEYGKFPAASSEHAVAALIRLVSAHPGEVDIMLIGPLTNLAMAIRLEPALPEKIRSLVIMGGAVASRGNTTFSAEFNFYADPEAAHVVLSSFPASKCLLVPWELCLQHALRWDAFDKLTSLGTLESKFVKATARAYELVSRYGRLEEVKLHGGLAAGPEHGQHSKTTDLADALSHPPAASLHHAHGGSGSEEGKGKPHHVLAHAEVDVPKGKGKEKEEASPVVGYTPCDGYAAAAYLRPELIKRHRDVYAVIELAGAHSRGAMFADWYGSRAKGKAPNVRVVEEIDDEGFFKLLLTAVGSTA